MSVAVKVAFIANHFLFYKEALIYQKSQWTPLLYPKSPDGADGLILKFQKKISHIRSYLESIYVNAASKILQPLRLTDTVQPPAIFSISQAAT